MKVGNKMTFPCLDHKCKGNIKGNYGGDIYLKENGYLGEDRIKYSQMINCQCDQAKPATA